MYKRVEQTFYALSSFALLGVLFVASPHQHLAVQDFQNEIVSQVSMAWQPISPSLQPLADIELVFESVDGFYAESSKQMIAMLDVHEALPNYDYVAYAVAETLKPSQLALFAAPKTEAPKVVRGESKSNDFANWVAGYRFDQLEKIAVSRLEVKKAPESPVKEQGTVAGISSEKTYYEMTEPVNTPQRPWVTIKDDITGEKYCVAIYNGEVNKYSGACKYDYN